MGSTINAREESPHVSFDHEETKLLPQSHTTGPQALPEFHEAMLQEQPLPPAGESNSTKQLPRWILGSGSCLNNYIKVYILCLHVIIVVLLAVLWLQHDMPDSTLINGYGSWSPPRDFVKFQITSYWPSKHNSLSMYGGPPTSEQDTAWDNVFSSMYFAASREEVIRAGETIDDKMVKVTGGGYLATLGVYHELHCVRQLRLHLYQDRYYHNLTDKQQAYNRMHLDHCLEVLRLMVMCYGNIDMFTFESQSLTPQKPTIKSNAKSSCVDWSSLQHWSQLRALNATQHAATPSIWNLTSTKVDGD
ncbi:hypothetical protein F5Y10DRAFT_272792 [Nemania abortiva]|nr:hypothetical protein F5Y10DRAFT_272792 [Nemania abortiva]